MKKLIIFSTALFLLTCSAVLYAEQVNLSTCEWMPYTGKRINNNGYVHEIVNEVFKRSGIAVDIHFYPWARAYNTAKNGRSDGTFPVYYDESRLDYFVYSDSFPGGPVGLYKQKSLEITYAVDPRLDQTTALKALKQYRFGVVRGYINTKAFDNASFLKKEVANCDETNLKKLFGGRLDFIFIDKYVAKQIIANKYPHFEAKLEFMEPPFEVKSLSVAFSKKAKRYESKLKIFNAGLKQLKEENKLTSIMEKHGFLMKNCVKTLVELN